MQKKIALFFLLATILFQIKICAAYEFDKEETLPTNAWWKSTTDGAQYGLSNTKLAQVLLDDGESVVRTVRPGDLIVHVHLPDGRIHKVLLHIYGDPIDGSGVSSTYREEALWYVNEYRARYDLPPLNLDYELCYYADIRAKEIMDVYEHTRPDGSDCFTVYTNLKRTAGENIAKNYHTTKSVVDAWFESPEHRENILNPEFTEMGISLYINMTTRDAMFWAQLFRG